MQMTSKAEYDANFHDLNLIQVNLKSRPILIKFNV